MRIPTRLLAGLATVAVAGAGASLAHAHSSVKTSSPKAGATASTRITTVTVTFTGPIRKGTLRVVGPNNRVVSTSSGGRDPRNIARLRVGLRKGLKAGAYRTTYTVTFADGHRESKTIRFRLRAPR